MKVKDFNKIRSAMYYEAIKNKEVAKDLQINDTCSIYEIWDGKGQHGFMVITAKTQLNDNALRERNFDIETVHIEFKMKLHRTTKQASW